MGHLHSIYDTDPHFSIDPVTRVIANQSEKVTIVQGDHNSERFTFELPRYIDGHDMSTCNVVQIHYVNTDSTSKKSYADVYPVNDLQVSPEGDDVVICSWLVSGNGTQYAGQLTFALRFCCSSEEGVIDYDWNTAPFTGISVSSGIRNSEAVVERNPDAIAQLSAEIAEGDKRLERQILDVEIDLLDRKLDKTEAKTLYSNILKGSKTETSSKVFIDDILEGSNIDVEVTALNQTPYPYDGSKYEYGDIKFTPRTSSPQTIGVGMGVNDSEKECYYHFLIYRSSNFSLKPNTTYVIRSNITNESQNNLFLKVQFDGVDSGERYDYSTFRYADYGGKRGEVTFTTPNEVLKIYRMSFVIPKGGRVPSSVESCRPEIYELPTYISVTDDNGVGNNYDFTTKNHSKMVYRYENVKGYYPTTCVQMYDTDTAYGIKCTYNRDINSAFEELKQAIIGLGQSV